jgi:Icc-related predicted phosphoesterase
MRILVVGDPHGSINKLRKINFKNIDLILCTGDIGKADIARERFFENVRRRDQGLEELYEDVKQIEEEHMEIHNSTIEVMKFLSKHAPTYTIQGNVSIPSQSETKRLNNKWGLKLPSTMNSLKKMKNVYVVKNRLRKINGLRIGFLEFFVDTNWVQDFKPTNYNKRLKSAKKQTHKAKMILDRFGENLDILLFHQPPYKVLDKVGAPAPTHWRGKNAGSKVIRDFIEKNKPKYGFCGHIHEGEGKKKIGSTEVYNLGVAGHKIIKL